MLIVLFSDEKYQKSAKRAFPSLCELTPRARVSRASHAWQVCAANGRAKVGDFALRAISAIPRVRTHHTKKPSRFVHALSARPLKVQGGYGWSPCADGIEYIFFAFSVGYTWILCVGRWLAAAVETYSNFSFIVLFSDEEEGSGWRSHL